MLKMQMAGKSKRIIDHDDDVIIRDYKHVKNSILKLHYFLTFIHYLFIVRVNSGLIRFKNNPGIHPSSTNFLM
jgi:hypothetical protein